MLESELSGVRRVDRPRKTWIDSVREILEWRCDRIATRGDRV